MGRREMHTNFSPETSSKEFTLDTQGYRQIYELSAIEHGKEISYSAIFLEICRLAEWLARDSQGLCSTKLKREIL
jgi:hypothetical protein